MVSILEFTIFIAVERSESVAYVDLMVLISDLIENYSVSTLSILVYKPCSTV